MTNPTDTSGLNHKWRVPRRHGFDHEIGKHQGHHLRIGSDRSLEERNLKISGPLPGPRRLGNKLEPRIQHLPPHTPHKPVRLSVAIKQPVIERPPPDIRGQRSLHRRRNTVPKPKPQGGSTRPVNVDVRVVIPHMVGKPVKNQRLVKHISKGSKNLRRLHTTSWTQAQTQRPRQHPILDPHTLPARTGAGRRSPQPRRPPTPYPRTFPAANSAVCPTAPLDV